MLPRPLPPIDYLRECFRVDESGALYWRHRPDSHFATSGHAAGWNTRNAGHRACRPVQSSAREGRTDLTVRFTFEGRLVRTTAARVVFKIQTGHEPEQVDHINGDTLDNRPGNLRAATAQTNKCNVPGYGSRLLPKGVYHRSGHFFSQATWARKSHFLGRFSTPGEAHAAWCDWTRERHGAFFNPGEAKPTIFD